MNSIVNSPKNLIYKLNSKARSILSWLVVLVYYHVLVDQHIALVLLRNIKYNTATDALALKFTFPSFWS